MQGLDFSTVNWRACKLWHRVPQGIECRNARVLHRPKDVSASATQRPKRSPRVNTVDYTASDAPERRKNPELYTKVLDDVTSANYSSNKKLEMKKPEVLAPAGGWPQLHAAAENGADAVYFGLEEFNARKRAANFTYEELYEVMKYLRERGMKGYATINVLTFDTELVRVEEALRHCARSGVDAIIVQDPGVVKLARRVVPSLPVHASTQMSITSAEGAEFAYALGTDRVVVGRELSVREIASVAASTRAEIECFVHGAMCVSYSGQCFSSEAWGGRSANRGQCAQACRLPYGLVVDGALKDLADLKYLLSPQDLMAVDHVPELIAAGVSCFKIEGRLKGPEYVALTTQVYRRAVDAAWEALQASPENAPPQPRSVLKDDDLTALRQVFARGQDETHGGLTSGFLGGVRHQELIRGNAPKHRGVLVGCVVGVQRRGRGGRRESAPACVVAVELRGVGVKLGDGVAFDEGSPEREAGGLIYGMNAGGRAVVGGEEVGEGVVRMEVRGGAMGSVSVGARVWRTRDVALENRVRKTYESLPEAQRRRLPVHVSVSGALGEPLMVTVWDDAGHSSSASTSTALVAASSRPLDEAAVAKAIGGFGGSPLRVLDLDVSGLALAEGLFASLAEVKAARREAVEGFLEALEAHGRAEGEARGKKAEAMMREARGVKGGVGGEERRRERDEGQDLRGVTKISVLCRTPQQVEAALEVPWLEEIVLDFLEVHGLQEWVRRVQDRGVRAVAACPRVLKPDEERLATFYLGLKADALLVRSAGFLHSLTQQGGEDVPELRGDFSLNVANSLSAEIFLASGLKRLAPTHDLNAAQVSALGTDFGAPWKPDLRGALEAIVHQHLPIFHTEACVFCRFLSNGNSYKDCGHPCERSTVHLRDEHGRDHLVLADMGCRNTVFNAQAQSGAHHMRTWSLSGYGWLRVELVDEPADAVGPLLDGYRAVLGGQTTSRELWEFLETVPDKNGRCHGVTEGSLAVRQEQATQLKPTAASLKHGAK